MKKEIINEKEIQEIVSKIIEKKFEEKDQKFTKSLVTKELKEKGEKIKQKLKDINYIEKIVQGIITTSILKITDKIEGVIDEIIEKGFNRR